MAPANIELGSAFRKRYGRLAHFEVQSGADSEEYRLDFCSPAEAWRMNRGKGWCYFYFFAAIAAVGLLLMLRPTVVLQALPAFE
jgi:hypothetical protein